MRTVGVAVFLVAVFCAPCANAAPVTSLSVIRVGMVDDSAPPPLTDEQKSSIKEILRLNKLATAGVALRVSKIAREIYANLLSDHPDAKAGRALSAKLHSTSGELLTLHGQAMRQVLAKLTVEQRHYVRDRMGTPDLPADLLELIIRIYGLAE